VALYRVGSAHSDPDPPAPAAGDLGRHKEAVQPQRELLQQLSKV
jgi:hypothetical protein